MPRALFEPQVERLTVLYDNDCGFCRWSVMQLRPLDRDRRLEFVPLQHAEEHLERPELATLARTENLRDAIHVVRPDGRVRSAGGAMFEILDALPGGWLLRPWALLPGIESLADVGYRFVADRRDMWVSLLNRTGAGVPACDIHTPSVRDA
jgi:predicted DCC family thiol-disulfide oxidoreductase YuxK